MATVHLKDRRARPFFYRHPWVFSGAVGRIEGEPDDGDVVDVAAAGGKFVGRGFINRRSQIVVRLLTWEQDEQIDRAFFERRIAAARSLREGVLGLAGADDAFRLIFSESDGLPGLIVDRYGRWLAVQILSLGMRMMRDTIFDVLDGAQRPAGIYQRSPADVAQLEGLLVVNAPVRGEAPPGDLQVEIDGIKFCVNIRAGQKTGLYLDQRANRGVIAALANGRSVFDGFTYSGGFAIAAAMAGASEVAAADTSGPAIEMARQNAQLNGVPEIEFVQADVIDTLREFRRTDRRFDLVILDPPKLAHSRQQVKRAAGHYRDLNASGLASVTPGGLLVTFSCSQHVGVETFESIINEAAVQAGRTVQILERLTQPPDHPVITSCPETRYLKGAVCRCR